MSDENKGQEPQDQNLPAVYAEIPLVDGSLQPTNFAGLVEMAKVFAHSEMVPREYAKKPKKIIVAWTLGMKLGFDWLSSLQDIAVVHGKATVYGDATTGLIMEKVDEMEEYWNIPSLDGNPGGRCEIYNGPANLDEWDDDVTAVCVIKRKGVKTPYQGSFSVADAKRIGKWNKPTDKGYDSVWMKSPKDMLQWRARHRAQKKGFSDLLRGLTPREVVDDYRDEDTIDLEPSNGDSYEMAKQELPGDKVRRDDFEKLMDDLVDKSVRDYVNEFVALAGENNGMSPEQVKASATDNIDEFVKMFNEWLKVVLDPGPSAAGNVADSEDDVQTDNSVDSDNDSDNPPIEAYGNELDRPEGLNPEVTGEVFQDPPAPGIDEDGFSEDMDPEKKAEIMSAATAGTEGPGDAGIPRPSDAKTDAELEDEARIGDDEKTFRHLNSANKNQFEERCKANVPFLERLRMAQPGKYKTLFNKWRRFYPAKEWLMLQQRSLFQDEPEYKDKYQRMETFFPKELDQACMELKMAKTATSKEAVDIIEKKVMEIVDRNATKGK